jgi:exopolysaccharide biosynthesis polyprenyl glycosylphosphotransferase
MIGHTDPTHSHHNARKELINEMLVLTPRERDGATLVPGPKRDHRVPVSAVEYPSSDLTLWDSLEARDPFLSLYLGRRTLPPFDLALKRLIDMLFSSVMLVILSPAIFAIAAAVKLDSRGPAFYVSNRVGKNGRSFRCIKFRTMDCDAEKRRAELQHMNERDGVLFKITNDPRITRLGRFLRKYSLDEVPQLMNVLRGEMSIVGPRPPLASEVREYKLSHLRRLSVTPGITGLWQVQARQDPSFNSYISLDLSYIENWSIWLDLKIMLKTIGVVIAGTGS